MNKKLTVSNMLSVFPFSLSKDPLKKALAKCIAGALSELYSDCDKLAIYPNLDNVPEDLLDILAQDLKVDWYLYDGTVETKRAQIRSTEYVHKHLGTVPALERVLSDLYPGADVEEWDEYNGTPGHIRIGINTERDFDFKTAQRIVDSVKRCSAHVDDIKMSTEYPSELYLGSVLILEGEYEFAMENVEFDTFDYITDENGNILTTEDGKILII